MLKIDGHNVAGYRDEEGAVHACSAVCTHMGCLVGWNETDRTWDCPCHGSRFALDGERHPRPGGQAAGAGRGEGGGSGVGTVTFTRRSARIAQA